LGSGHVEEGYGVPHQLRDLGVAELKTLIPVSVEDACAHVGASYADAVFALPRTDEAPPPERPRLGVLLARGDGAPHIQGVAGDSVGEIAGLKAGDFVVRAAGLEMRNSNDLVEIVGRQAPGTWLPLSIRRDGQEIDLIAKFPARLTQGR
jgi:S1-C subfamily serine protease